MSCEAFHTDVEPNRLCHSQPCFDVNAMYVTGPITSAQRQGSTIEFRGTAKVTGIGAGTDVPFVGVAARGGPGTTFVLEVSGLTFKEIVLEGQISF